METIITLAIMMVSFPAYLLGSFAIYSKLKEVCAYDSDAPMWFAYVAYTGIAPISGIYYGIGSSEMIKLLSFFWVVLPIIILVLKGDQRL